ncbi:MAG: NADH-quinone oxidoreductase subunit J [Candidatus Marinimicrobia bacterium]|nr:NADH-quinone oxidoreductase subunit J [Candidatus Neomarinimicrobiota bacterium]
MADLLFLFISILVIASAVNVVISSQLIYSAVSLLFTLFGVAGLYVFLYADFMAATQVIIYVGGILVLIIFGVMLTNKIDTPNIVSSSSNQVIGFFAASFLFLIQLAVIVKTDWKQGEVQQIEGTVDVIGSMLLWDYFLAFEVVSILLLAALIGAAFLSRRNA